MERDIEKLIQNKVMDAERRPMPWRKEQVWANISTGLYEKQFSRRIYSYYAAACVALILVGTLYFGMPHREDPKVATTDQSIPLEAKTKIDSIASSPVVQTPVIAERTKKNVLPQKDRMSIPVPSVPETSSLVAENTATVSAEDTLASPQLVEVVQPEKKERIKPVIGVFDPVEPRQEIVEEKKHKRLPRIRLRHDDSSPLENPSETIIARIH